MNDARLYLILDRQVNSYEQLFEIARKAIGAGVDIIQLRDKTGSAREILEFLRQILKIAKGRVPFIVNDRVDLAAASHASGVHLGQEDMPLAAARKILGQRALIGISCQTWAHAQKAQEDGADYIGFGSVFKTLTKPDRAAMDLRLLTKVAENIVTPVFAIGGIDLNNLMRVKATGIRRIAVCRAICEAQDVDQAVRQFKSMIN